MSRHRPLTKTAAEGEAIAAFDAGVASANQRAAFARFASLGLPNRRTESWHYTDFRAALTHFAPLAPAPDSSAVEAARATLASEPKTGAARFVLVNGYFVAALSDPAPAGVSLDPSPEDVAIPADSDPVLALTAALARGGLTLHVGEGADAGRVEILRIDAAPAMAVFSRFGVRLGSGAKLTVFERHIGAVEDTQRFEFASLTLAAQARLEHVVAIEDEAALHIESVTADLAEGAELRGFGFVSAGAFVRRQIFAGHRQPHASLAFSGLSLLSGSRRADSTLEVTHGAPLGKSREFFRHIVADEAVGTYQGKVIVAPHAQKTDGGMKSQAILLSPTAVMNNKPELEIFADDVVCGHGATVGALDPEQVFYLEARGIPRAEAEAMLLEAFGVEAIDRVEDEGLAEALKARLAAWLAKR